MAITLSQLRTFAAVAQAGSVHAAAAQLSVSQPSVSAALSSLRRELGTALVERRGRGIALTAAGEAFVPYVRRLLGLLEDGWRAAAEAAEPDAGSLRLAAVNTAGEYLLPPVIDAFRRLHPGIEVLLEIGNRRSVLQRLESRAVDVAVGGRPPSDQVIGRKIVPNELVVVAREAPKSLREATWLMREEGSGTRATAEAYLAEQGIAPRELLTLGSNGAVKQALALGLGVALVSAHAVARELAGGTLVRVPAPGTPLSRPWYSLRPAGPPPRPAVRAFLELLHSPEGREVALRGLRVGGLSSGARAE